MFFDIYTTLWYSFDILLILCPSSAHLCSGSGSLVSDVEETVRWKDSRQTYLIGTLCVYIYIYSYIVFFFNVEITLRHVLQALFIGIFRTPLIISLYVRIKPYLAKHLYKQGQTIQAYNEGAHNRTPKNPYEFLKAVSSGNMFFISPRLGLVVFPNIGQLQINFHVVFFVWFSRESGFLVFRGAP